jgi:hypothetical protein
MPCVSSSLVLLSIFTTLACAQLNATAAASLALVPAAATDVNSPIDTSLPAAGGGGAVGGICYATPRSNFISDQAYDESILNFNTKLLPYMRQTMCGPACSGLLSCKLSVEIDPHTKLTFRKTNLDTAASCSASIWVKTRFRSLVSG